MSEERPARRGRPRVGDATQARIDDIADGWGKPATDKPAAAIAAPKIAKPRVMPPPPPGSVRRDPAASEKMPLPGPRAAPSSAPPPIPPARTRKSNPPPPPGARPALEPAPQADTPEPELPRAEGSPAPMPLAKASPPEDSVELDDDPTIVPTGDEREVESLELRTPAALPRALGIWGDMRYVFTVLFGLRRIRVELAETESEIEAEKRSRDKQLAELARLAIADDKIDTPVVEEARERLVDLEAARSKKAGTAAAVEEAIHTLQRERKKVAAERETKIAELEAEIAALVGEIEPLEKQRAAINRQVRDFKNKVDAYDRKIDARELELESGDAAAAVEAEAAIASLRAEREGVAAEEPVLARQLADIDPELRELKARRGDLTRTIARLRRAEDESVVRSDERIAAARAHKLVVDRAASDMSREQTELLTALGGKLYDRPPPSIARLALPVKETTVTLARLKDRAVALAEERASIDRMPLLRGAAMWLLILGVLGAAAFFALTWA